MTSTTIAGAEGVPAYCRACARSIERVTIEAVAPQTDPALVGVTAHARRDEVPAAQRPAGAVMIETNEAPAVRLVALRAVDARPAAVGLRVAARAARCGRRGAGRVT